MAKAAQIHPSEQRSSMKCLRIEWYSTHSLDISFIFMHINGTDLV